MATQTRRGYHHGDLANALTTAATELARQGGPEAVVLREAARKVGVSATAAYRHFASHGDLIHEVKDHCQVLLAEYMDAELAAAPPTDDPKAAALSRLRALGMGYLRFALGEPGLFRTAFCQTDSPREKTMESFESPAFDRLSAVLDELTELGLIDPARRPLAEAFPWATTHGLATLLINGPLAFLPEELRCELIVRTMESVIDGLCQTGQHPAA
jgi:AcrR family transcriptional regulator